VYSTAIGTPVYRFARIRYADGAADPLAARYASARDHVLGERRQLGEALFHARGDEGARALATRQQAFADQAVQRLADGDARDAELVGHVPLGGQGVVGRQHLLLDGLAQRALQLLVERGVLADGVQPSNPFSKRHFTASPNWPQQDWPQQDWPDKELAAQIGGAARLP
jgi:hypothetical protein